MNIQEYLPMLITVIGLLVTVVNIIVEVLKKFTEKYVPTNVLAVIISMVLTLTVFFAWCSINAVVVQWYLVVAAIVVGFFVAYAAMFGFDKLKEVLEGK